MDAKNISIKVVGSIWFIVGIALSIVGTKWLLLTGLGPKFFGLLFLSVLIGGLKGKKVLKKIAKRYYDGAEKIKFNDNDIFLGWVKILGVRGFILIASMMILGSILRHSTIDRPILGVIYLAVGIALLYASKVFFNKSKVK